MPNQLLLLTERFCSLLPLEWALLFKMIQTTWKDSPSPGTGSRLSVMPSSGLLRRWHAALRWRAGGHSVSWQELQAQAPWRHVSHHHWKSADRQTAGMLRWRRRRRERERQHLVLADFTVCPPLLSRQQPEHTAYSNLHRWPTATFKCYQAICNIQQPLHSEVWIWAKRWEKWGVSLMLLRKKKNRM